MKKIIFIDSSFSVGSFFLRGLPDEGAAYGSVRRIGSVDL